MADERHNERQEVRKQQLGSESQLQSGQGRPAQDSRDQGASQKQGEPSREHPPIQQTPKKDVQSSDQDRGKEKTGTH